jgi:sec-independent protein translocase protein TatA
MLDSITNFVAGYEWLWIIVVIGVVFLGAKKIPELARTFGRAKGDYEKGRIESEKDLKEFKEKHDSK